MQRLLVVVAAVAAVAVLAAPSVGAAESPQFRKIADRKLAGEPVGCVDVAWAGGEGLLEPAEVELLAELGVRCPDATVAREVVPSGQYVVMRTLAARGRLTCADIEWNAARRYLTTTATANLSGLVGGCAVSPYAQLVARLTSGRLACSDVEANLTTGVVSAVEAAWLRDAAGCLPPAATVDVLLEQLNAAAPHWGVRLTGIAVEDLRGGARWAVNGDQQMSFMSSAKIAWAVMAAAQAGTDAVEPFAYPVFARSDNDAAGSLIDLAGGIDRLNRYWYPTLGMVGSCHQRWNAGAVREFAGACGYPTNPVFDVAKGHMFWNHNTANDMTNLLGRLWRGQVPGLDAAEQARLLEWSTWPVASWAPDGDGTITGHLPPWTWPNVHHKVGWFFDPYLSASDVGIVDLPDATYALALAAYGGESSAAQADFLSWASCQVYRHLAGDSTWTCPPRADDARPGQLDVALARTATGSTLPTPIPGGRTSSHLITTPDVDLRVTIGPGGVDGERVTVRSTIPDCERTLTVTQPHTAISYTCRLVLPKGDGPPTAHRWTAVATSGAVTLGSGSAGALFTTPDTDGGLRLAERSAPSAQLDVAGQLDGR